MKALAPSRHGIVERNGYDIHWEIFGDGDQTIFFLPTWSIIPSRHWKAQIPYFARHFRVLTFDGIGNGNSSRAVDPAAYAEEAFAADALAVMDATDTERALLVSLSAGAGWGLILAAEHPERVTGAAFIAPSLPIAPGHPERNIPFDVPLATSEGWAKFNRHYWQRDYRDFLEYFFSRMFSEPHSTKQIEDCVGWGLETSADVLEATVRDSSLTRERVLELAARVRCPVLVIHGDEDAISPHARGAELAAETGGSLVTLEGAGHGPHARDPVRVNLLLRDFAKPRPAPRRWRRSKTRRRRVLYISSPIGLGHAQRDVAIARELRKLHPEIEIDWLAQHPVTEVLQRNGERIHPASKFLANESKHIESESAEHDLHCFQAWRRMDEILVANFMVFHDVVSESAYDLWIGDEAWELDYHLHENPEEKRAAYVWLTDFVGWLPNSDGDGREALLTADYNAEMIEHIARFPRVRDRAIFVGSANDVVPHRFGDGLPPIRQWTEEHYDFSGYITGFDPIGPGERARIREELGYGDHESICIVTVGGSGVGGHLLRKIIAAYPAAKARIPSLRMIVVAGPRIEACSLPKHPGLEIHAYVHDLYRHLAACDLALVQGGLTTTMELTANRRPFIYFPLRHHFEQRFHVRHRLERYGAGRAMEFDDATPEHLTAAIEEELGREVAYREVERDGAARAAAMIAELL